MTTQRGETTDPPQTCLPLQCRLTCHPHSSSAASVPPTIRRPSPARSEQSVCDKISSMMELKILRFITVLLFYCSSWMRIPVSPHLACTLTCGHSEPEPLVDVQKYTLRVVENWFNETHLSPAVLFPVWFPGFFGRKGSRVGTLQFPFRPQRGAKSLGSGAKTRNLTDFEEGGGERPLRWKLKSVHAWEAV